MALSVPMDGKAIYLKLRKSNDRENRNECHECNLVNHSDGTHTQHVETYTNRLKLKVKEMIGLSNEQIKMFSLDFYV